MYRGKLTVKEKSLMSIGTNQVFWRSVGTLVSNNCLISAGILCKLHVNLFKIARKKCKQQQVIAEAVCVSRCR